MVPSIFGENMLDDFFDGGFFGAHNPLYGKNARNLLKTDIREMDDSYELAVDLPGFKKDEINLDIKDGYLTVSAEKGLDKKEEDKKGRILRQERYAGVCSRSFYVGNVKPVHRKIIIFGAVAGRHKTVVGSALELLVGKIARFAVDCPAP